VPKLKFMQYPSEVGNSSRMDRSRLDGIIQSLTNFQRFRRGVSSTYRRKFAGAQDYSSDVIEM
jgi:hypothetical protein